jgi:hypothetical protein
LGLELESSLDEVLALGASVISSSIDISSNQSNDRQSDNNELFFSYLDQYLLALEDWQLKYGEKISNSEIILSLVQTEKAKKLRELHQEVMTKVSSTQGEISTELGQVSKKSAVIKRCIDVLPSRVSITKGKKG